ncbi:MAG: NAD-dependent epimerase/dehydratase family protein, partial [Flavobacteriales bacterium]
MAKILVTGGAGFIGSAMAIKLAGQSTNEVVVVD